MQNPSVLLVTGASRGIGAATALLAARQGWAVAVNYLGHSLAADEVVRAIRAEGGRAMAVQGNVAVEADVVRLFAQVDAKLGPLTGLVNNAGVVDVACRVDAMCVERLQRQWSVNVLGSFLIGILYVTLSKTSLSPLLITGVLGGFTTFSSFGSETLNLARDSQMMSALANIGANVILGLIAVWLGRTISYLIWR